MNSKGIDKISILDISKKRCKYVFQNIVEKRFVYYIDGADKPKKGVVVIVRDGKIQSMMPSDSKTFNKMQ